MKITVKSVVRSIQLKKLDDNLKTRIITLAKQYRGQE